MVHTLGRAFWQVGLAMPLRVSDNCSMALEITDELIARQSPEAQAIIRALLARLAELEARLNQTSRNSSVPPSSEHPHAKPKRDHQRSRRQRGGQPGHRKHERPLLPPEQCTDVQELKPSNCRRCGQGLAGGDSDPLRHQVWEVPVIQPEVIEYRRHRLVCPGCGEATCALVARRRPRGPVGATAGGLCRIADGLLSSEQTADGVVYGNAPAPAVLPGAHHQDANPGHCGFAAGL